MLNPKYEDVLDGVVEALEEIARVKAPPEDYLAALLEAQDRVDQWLSASIDAAHDDVARASD